MIVVRTTPGSWLLWVGLVVVALEKPVQAEEADVDADAWWGRDKALHFGVSAGIATGAYGVGTVLFDKRLDAALFGGAVALGVGAAKEGADALGYGTPSWRDFTWDAAGTLVGVALGLGIDLLLAHLGSLESGSSHGTVSEPEP